MPKCVPILYYDSDCCPVSKSQFNSLEFALRGSFMKIFDTRSKDIVLYCMKMFNVQSPYRETIKRKCKFLHNIMSAANLMKIFYSPYMVDNIKEETTEYK